MKLAIALLIGMFLAACGGEIQTDVPESPIGDVPVTKSGAIPRSMSWANRDLDGDGVGENYVTSIKAQPCSDCFMYAAVGLLEMQFQIDHGLSINLNLSEQSIHNCLRITCDGAGDQTIMLDHLKKYGVMAEEYAPTGIWYGCPNCAGYILTSVGWISIAGIPFYSFGEYRTVVSPSMPYGDRKMAMVKALQDGPLVMDVSSWWGWGNSNGTLYCKGQNPSGHAVVVVGYENYGDAFLVKNNHGEGKLIRMIFEGGYDCGFAHRVHQIVPGSTYASWGLGEKFCYAMTDSDRDGVPDTYDNCPYTENEDQKNSDNDLLGDACDPCSNDFNWFTGYYCASKPTATAEVSKMKWTVDVSPSKRL